MNNPAWIAQLAVWLLFYVLLLVGHHFWEQWLGGRFHQRPAGRVAPRLSRRDWPVIVVALLAGAVIPLAPANLSAPQSSSWRLPGDSSAALLYALALQWAGEAILIARAEFPLKKQGEARWNAHHSTLETHLVNAIPMLLIVLSLLLAVKPGSLRLTAWLEAQRKWNGLGWFAWRQPVAFLLWLICARPPAWTAQTQAGWSGQALTLNRALLTSALFMGGGGGPFVDRVPWLAVLYTTLQVGLIALVWTLARSALPPAVSNKHVQTVFKIAIPLSALNLIVTALIATR